jgi:hypothetical protein
VGSLVVLAALFGHARSALADSSTGVIEVCKNPSQDVAGKMFSFTVTPSGGQSQSVSVTADATNIECSSPLTVPAGQVTVAEGTSVGFTASAISVSGGGSLVSSDTANQSAVVNVAAGNTSTQTDVFFTNVLANGQLKVCKQAADGSDDLTPFNPFNFGVTGTGYTGPATVSANVGGCTLVSVPANLQLSISEALTSAQTSAGITLANITLGSGTNGTVDVGGNKATVMIAAGATAEVTFWNQKPKPAPTGFIEVCKAGGTDVAGKTFSFTVSDTVNPADANQTVTAGASGTTNCTLPIQVTAGNVTVMEATSVGFVVQSITSVPAGSLVSANTATGTATVTVAAGDQSTQTIVTFTNQAQTGTVKVCKAAAAGSNLTGMFTFNISGTGYTGPASVQTSVGNCALVSGVPVNAQLTVTEALTSAQTGAGISLASISLGSGTVGTTTATSATITVTGNAVSEVTFTNTQTQPGPQTGTLTICKIAGSGVNVGDSFSFTTATNGGSASAPISVMAGTANAPGCASAGTFNVGDSVVVTEAASTGVTVSAITGTSTINLGAGTATVTIVAGDNNKVTYTNTKASTPPTTSGCTFTKGYYKNHTEVLTAALVAKVNAALGTSLTADQMVAILSSPVAGNFGIQLAAQLITAELNIQSGASSTAAVNAAIAAAISDLVFDSSGNVTLAAGVTNASDVETVLDNYNEGQIGPGHCGESEGSSSTPSSSPSTPQQAPTQNVSATTTTTTTQQAAPVTTAAPASKPTAQKPAKKATKHVVKKKVVKKVVKKHVSKKAKKTHGAVKAARKTLPFTK